ncbi:iron complex transport system permease protein [Desulfosarcina sp. BuS5]|uniref:FecCD family ABC transporter permease n=1 Tax=Desulfosarcina sp. BuS5 TaxID=933262 RepID=UPI000553E362|nr:iron ABC transporter permease [Desulfosarcina sp. BuS5]WDN90404.1 iron complex transport system permease protein [Desulfosarcina sp. BuS5]
MPVNRSSIIKRITLISLILFIILLIVILAALAIGSTSTGIKAVYQAFFGHEDADSMTRAIILHLRLPRAVLAALVGAALSLGGLVFQAILRNPLAEPYILGISGGSAIGAILGILMGLSRFPGVSLLSFTGSIIILFLIIIISSGHSILKKDSLLLAGVMVNSFCSAVIMFLISMTQDSRLHNIMFWLMGDLSLADLNKAGILAAILCPCFILIFLLSNSMNILLLGKEMAITMGISVKAITLTLLITTSLMVSATVSNCGLIGFVGLVIPHILRLILGSDHRVLVPACILGGGTYMVVCDLMARTLPDQGEMPAGVITAMIGAPIFIFLLKKTKI